MNAIILLLFSTILHIASPTEPGQRLMLTGKVFGPDGKPRAGVEMEVWHTDASGYYRADHGTDGPPRLHGTLRTRADGYYAIDTIKPGLYPGAKRGAHIHFKIDGVTQTLFIDGGQPLLQLTRDAHGVLHGTYDFHLGGGTR